MKTRRKFVGTVLDASGVPVLKINRPIKWLLNSEIQILDMDDNVIGEVKQ